MIEYDEIINFINEISKLHINILDAIEDKNLEGINVNKKDFKFIFDNFEKSLNHSLKLISRGEYENILDDISIFIKEDINYYNDLLKELKINNSLLSEYFDFCKTFIKKINE